MDTIPNTEREIRIEIKRWTEEAMIQKELGNKQLAGNALTIIDLLIERLEIVIHQNHEKVRADK